MLRHRLDEGDKLRKCTLGRLKRTNEELLVRESLMESIDDLMRRVNHGRYDGCNGPPLLQIALPSVVHLDSTNSKTTQVASIRTLRRQLASSDVDRLVGVNRVAPRSACRVS